MNQPENTIDLDECAREQIHLTGAIRPSGCLISFERDDFRIRFASENITAILPVSAEELLGTPLTDHISGDLHARITSDITKLVPGRRVLQHYQWPQIVHPRATMLWLVPDDALVTLEIVLARDSLAEVNDRVHRLIDWSVMESEQDINRLMQVAAETIRDLTEYDRVMVYRFAEDYSGEVAAEAVREDLESYIGLHYPGADIPEQARKLFVLNRVRIIEDVDYKPVPLQADGEDAKPLDLSLSLLRSVSPIHVQYLQNMGVKGSLAISLIRDGKLWGMVACHHYSTKPVAPALLKATELMSQLLSVLCERAERIQRDNYAALCRERMAEVLDTVTSDTIGIMPAVVNNLHRIAAMIDADGVVLVDGNAIEQFGDVPGQDSVLAICDWLEAREPTDIYSTEQLGEAWPGAAGHADLSPGLLALRWVVNRRAWLLWFRNERVESVTWAGNPTKAVVRDPQGRLTPRGSFDAWKSEVRGRALPWSEVEENTVRPLRRLATLDDLNEAARESRSAHGRFLGSVHDPVIIVDLEGRIVEWNNAVETNLGVERAKGKQLDALVKFAHDAHLPALLNQAASGQVWVGEYERPGDQPTYYEVALMPVPREEGREVQTVAVALRDITERRILEEQLHQAKKMEALGQLTGGVAHNFNNLLTVILGSADMIISQVEADSPLMPDLRLLRSTCEDAAKIINELMAFARQDRTDPTKIDIVESIAQLARLLKGTIPARIQIETTLPSTQLWVSVDRIQLEQVIMNLAFNARDSIEVSGSITFRAFSVKLSKDAGLAQNLAPGNYVTIEVADTGTGVPADIVNQIFDPFFTTKTNTGGTGLGLSSSFGIINKHGGRLSVKSTEGKGSVFSILLPAVESHMEETKVGEALKLNILLVDDEPTMRMMLSRLLTTKGHQVREAASGVDALEVIDSEVGADIDLVISDQLMPKMIGTEFLHRVRQRYPDLPAILMSAHTGDTWPEETPVQRFLQKPFGADALLKIIDQLCDKNQGKA